jgi:hypothetical protein
VGQVDRSGRVGGGVEYLEDRSKRTAQNTADDGISVPSHQHEQ